MKSHLLIFAFIFQCFTSFAYEYVIQGQIIHTLDFERPFEQELFIHIPDQLLDTTIVADIEGNFSVSLDITTEIAAPVRIRVSTMDWCTGDLQTQEVQTVEAGIAELIFFSCAEPPCQAGFIPYRHDDDPLTITFTDESWTANIVEHHWDFGDGATSNSSSPTHTYTERGTYEVTYEILTENGCSASIQQTVEVGSLDAHLQCVVFIEANQSTPHPNQVQFHAETLLEPLAFEWSFGDGETSTEMHPEHTYAAEGEYEVHVLVYLLVEGDTCTAEASLIIEVSNEAGSTCRANFEWGSDDFQNRFFFFQDASYATEEIIAWLWDFGDGNYGTVQNPTHEYEINGELKVTLTILTADSCQSRIAHDIWVGDWSNDECYAAFEWYADTTDASSTTMVFEDYSRGDSIIAWRWDFGDGHFSEEQNPIHTYDIEGAYPVILEISTINGCSNVIVLQVSVGGCVCPTYEDPVCILIPSTGEIRAFSNSCFAECAGYTDFFPCEEECECGEIYDPVCVFLDNGERLFFDNPCEAECRGYTDYTRCMEDCACDAVYDPVCVLIPSTGEIRTFSNSCYAECEGYTDFFSCEEECNCTGIYDPVCVITDTGEYIEFSNPCFAECEGYDEYRFCEGEHGDCQAGFSWQIVDSDPSRLTVQFRDHSSEGTVNWFWDFGDGHQSYEQNPQHTFANEGVHYVELHATNADSCSNALVQRVYVGEGCVCPEYYDPVCTIDPITGDILTFSNPCFAECEGFTDFFNCDDGGGDWDNRGDCQAMFWFTLEDNLTVQFEDLSSTTDDAITWEWDFGNGQASNEQNPTHSYEEEGIYFVTLTVADAELCRSSFSMLVWTSEEALYSEDCRALFFPIINDNQVLLLDVSQGNVVNWEWDLGDGTTANTPFVQHTYTTDATVNITLTITTADGCTSSFAIVLDISTGNFHGDSNPAALTSSMDDLAIGINEILVYPNPVKNVAILQLNATQNTDYQLFIIDVNGRVLQKESSVFTKGENNLQVDLSALPKGVYTLNIRSNGAIWSERVVKL